jgi:hypothetical protein
MDTPKREYTIREGIQRSSGDGVQGRPAKDLIQEMISEGQHLLREEVRLAKAEITAEAKEAGKNVGIMGAGGVIAHVALFCFAACLTLLLAGAMPAWIAAFIVTLVYAAVGGALFFWGKNLAAEKSLKPEHTMRTLEEDKRWMKSTAQNMKSRVRANA